MTLSPKQTAILWRFLLILAVTDLPIVSAQLTAPTFDWRLLVAGLITGVLAALEKLASPQLASVILPNPTVMQPDPASPTVPSTVPHG